MNEYNRIIKNEIYKLRAKAAQKRRDADYLDRKADEIEKKAKENE